MTKEPQLFWGLHYLTIAKGLWDESCKIFLILRKRKRKRIIGWSL